MAGRNDSMNLTHSEINAGDAFYDLCCTDCSKKCLNREASKYCTECQQYFCVSCVENHDSFPVLLGHVLVNPNVAKPSSSTSGRMCQALPTELCKKHHLKLMDMYCKDDDAVGCSACMTLEHKSCADIYYIPEYVHSNSPAKQVHTVNNNLTKAIKTMKTLKAQHDRLDENLDKTKLTCKQEIQKYREDINQTIDLIEAATLAELDARHKDTKQKTGDTHQRIQDVYDELVRFKSEIESDQSNDSQKFVIAKLSQRTIVHCQELQSDLPHVQTTRLKFNRNTDIMTFLLHIVTLGMLSPPVIPDSSTTKPSPSGDTSNYNKVSTRQQHATVVTQPLKQGLYKVSDKCTYNLNDYETICNIRSSCIIDNGDILLGFNNLLQLIDSRTYAIRSTLVLDGTPWSVCKVNSTEAVVCTHRTIQFVSTCGQLVPIRSLGMDHECSGIAVIRDKMYVGELQSVHIYTLNGELVETIRKYRSDTYSQSSDDIFSYIWDITVSDDEKMIHVADLDKGVITLNTDGNVLWKYSSTELRRACKICTDGNDNVIVCGKWSQNVIQLGPDGQYMGEIVSCSDGVCSPQIVCYDSNNHKLIVGPARNNKITVFTVTTVPNTT